MAGACHWPSPSTAPMCLTRNWSPRLWTPSRSNVRSPIPNSRNISVSTKATPENRLIAKFAGEAIRLTCRRRLTSPRSRAPARQGAPLESRTHPLLAQPRPALADPLGKESRKLPRLLASSIRYRHATNRRGSRIGSYSNTTCHHPF